MKFKKEDLFKLRKQILLGSLYYRDYENTCGVSVVDCITFFDGYLDYLNEIKQEETAENLEEWFYIGGYVLYGLKGW